MLPDQKLIIDQADIVIVEGLNVLQPAKLPKDETVFAEDTSILFKETRIVRLWDEANRTLVYLAISRKVIEGAPANAISTVPVMPWGGR